MDNENGPCVRILRPVSVDCMQSRRRYKRSRKEQTTWWGGAVGNGVRRWLTARRRQGAGAGEGVGDESKGVLETTPKFGGSGARFGTLRNRRGVRGGTDGLVQTRLRLSIVNDAGGKFSLVAGESAGMNQKNEPKNGGQVYNPQ